MEVTRIERTVSNENSKVHFGVIIAMCSYSWHLDLSVHLSLPPSITSVSSLTLETRGLKFSIQTRAWVIQKFQPSIFKSEGEV